MIYETKMLEFEQFLFCEVAESAYCFNLRPFFLAYNSQFDFSQSDCNLIIVLG